MTTPSRLASAVVLTACVLFTCVGFSQTAYKSKANPNYPSGADDADKMRAAAPAATTDTLSNAHVTTTMQEAMLIVRIAKTGTTL